MKTVILSDGGWGTALAQLLCTNQHQTMLWGPFPENIEAIRNTRENQPFLPGVKLDDRLMVTNDMAEAASDADLIVLATPSQYMRATLNQLRPYYKPETPLVNVAKGIEIDTLFTISQLCHDVLGPCNYTILSGPSHAEEVARRVPTAVVVASESPESADLVQDAFMNDYFRVYTSSDVVGVELGGSLKNVFAIAAGMIDGMQLGDNPKAALITRGITEMSRLGTALGGLSETFSGLSGIGDLIVTCCSGHSRNRHVGEELGRGKKLQAIIEEMGMVVAEGVKTAKSAHDLAQKNAVETPIISQIYAIIYEDKDPRVSVKELMTRKARTERDEF